MPTADFVAPRPSSLVQGSCRSALPLILMKRRIVGIDYDPSDLARFRELSRYRLLITPNHPTHNDPVALFHLSALLGHPFFFVAAREVFDGTWGLRRWIMSRLGAFSVVRGTMDRASYRMARELLTRPDCKLVAFPEGEIYSQNDTLLPFHSGMFQIAFWALEDSRKAGRIDEPLFVLPVALKYRYVEKMDAEIKASLERLVRFTGAKVEIGMSDYTRLRCIGEAMLQSLEREYRITPNPNDIHDLTFRLDAVKEAILVRVAAAAGVALPKGDTLVERMRGLIHVIETVSREEPLDKTPYDTELRRQQRERARPLLNDLRRLSNWIAVYDGYVRSRPTVERMADLLVRLERECFGAETLRGKMRCEIRVGEPLDLRECWPAYEKSRRSEVARVTDVIERRVADLLGASPVPEGLFA